MRKPRELSQLGDDSTRSASSKSNFQFTSIIKKRNIQSPNLLANQMPKLDFERTKQEFKEYEQKVMKRHTLSEQRISSTASKAKDLAEEIHKTLSGVKETVQTFVDHIEDEKEKVLEQDQERNSQQAKYCTP